LQRYFGESLNSNARAIALSPCSDKKKALFAPDEGQVLDVWTYEHAVQRIIEPWRIEDGSAGRALAEVMKQVL
jgi:hypothetical protein